jgi:hypothetical protein
MILGGLGGKRYIKNRGLGVWGISFGIGLGCYEGGGWEKIF